MSDAPPLLDQLPTVHPRLGDAVHTTGVRRPSPARTRWWVLTLVPLATACAHSSVDGSSPASATHAGSPTTTPAKPANAVAKAPEEPSPPPIEPPPEGWTRLDLSTVVPTFTGTIDMPPGLTAEVTARQEIDAEGLEADAREVRIGQRGSGVTLETMAEIPSRFASADAMARFHGNFEHVSTHEFGPGHWAVVQQWRPGECMLHGWSAAAGLTCNVFQAPCEEMAQRVQICGTLRPGPAPNAAPTTPSSAFPELDPAAAEVAMTVARAVVHNDSAMLLGALGPKGLRIAKKAYTAESLQKALSSKSVLHVVAPIYRSEGDGTEGLFNWTGESSKDDGVATIWFTSGYGEQPFFALEQTGETWHLIEFGVFDFGEP